MIIGLSVLPVFRFEMLRNEFHFTEVHCGINRNRSRAK